MSSSPRRVPEQAPPRKPMARATRVTLFEREVRERLSGAAVELLLGSARVLSEGELARSKGGGVAFFGTTMLTMELGSVSSAVREPCDAAAAARVAALLKGDPRVARLVKQVAEQEAATLAGGAVRTTASELRVRAQGTTVYLDVDLEARLRK